MKKAVFVIHGFTGGRYQLEPLLDYLKNIDYDIITPKLKGHDEKLNLKGVIHSDWIDDVIKQFKDIEDLYDEIYIVGYSMGGLLTTHLYKEVKSKKIKKIIFISAAFYHTNYHRVFNDGYRLIQEAYIRLAHPYLRPKYINVLLNTPRSAQKEFMKLAKNSRNLINEIDIPVLIIHGSKDGMVPKKTVQYIYDNVNTDKKDIIIYPKGRHLICWMNDNIEMFDKIHEFINRENII